jgi:tRNA modification GTPase
MKGTDELKQLLMSFYDNKRPTGNDVIISNIRHFEALKKVSESLARVEEGLSAGIPQDIAATDIRQAIHYLGEITGEISNDEILGNIFRNFCIGK